MPPRHQQSTRARLTGRVPSALLLIPTLCLGGVLTGQRSAHHPGIVRLVESGSRQVQGYGSLPLAFEPNVGQAPANVRYLAHGNGYTLYLTNLGAMVSLARAGHCADTGCTGRPHSNLHGSWPGGGNARPRRTAILELLPAGGNSRARMTAEGKRSGVVNYFIGNDRSKWLTDIPTYSRVVYRGVYPGIDLAFYGNAGRLEYDWLIRPHADPWAIATVIRGAQRTRLDQRGNLLISTNAGTLTLPPPRVYQTTTSRRKAVPARYQMHGRDRVAFCLAPYDSSRSLTIDPVLSFSTYLGTDTSPTGIAVDTEGDTLLTGPTVSGEIPTRHPFQSMDAGTTDAFITELNPTGSDLVFSTYLGGSNIDAGNGIAVDPSGNIWVSGYTSSPDFPMLSAPGTHPVAFAAKLSPTGDAINWVVSHSPSPDDDSVGLGIATDSQGNAFQCERIRHPSGSEAAWIAELNPDGGATQFTDFGASGADFVIPTGVAVDGQDNSYLVVDTAASDLPVHAALQAKFAGADDAYIVKLDAQFNVVYATYLGGKGADIPTGIGVDQAGDAYITGSTMSTDFPVIAPLQRSLVGTQGSFITEINASGTALTYSTYISAHEQYAGMYLHSISVTGDGTAYVTGETSAYDFPSVDPLPGAVFKGDDAVVVALAPGGQSFLFSTYLGGVGQDIGQSIAVDADGNVYVAGSTSSTDFPAAPSAFQHGLSGLNSMFVVKLAPGSSSPTATPTATSTAIPTATFTPTSTPTASATPIPSATSTATPTSTPTSTPTPLPTPTPTHTPVPPPAKPELFLKSSQVSAGKKLALTVLTDPDATVQITISVKDKVTKLMLYRTAKAGTADERGRFTTKIRISFQPAKATTARISVTVRTPGGSASASVSFTILPHS